MKYFALLLTILSVTFSEAFVATHRSRAVSRTSLGAKAGEIDEDAFDSLLESSSKPILVDFWATWCGPCKLVAPLMDEAVDEYGESMEVLKIDVTSKNKSLLKRYQIRGLPYIAVFNDGKLVSGNEGAVSKAKLDGFIKAAVPGIKKA